MSSRLERLERREHLNGASSGICCCPFCSPPPSSTSLGGDGNGASFGDDALVPRGATGDYQIGSRWSSTASGSTGSSGSPATISWSIVPDGLSIPGFNGEPTSNSNLVARLNAKYGSQATWLPLFQSVFDRWSAVSGLTYIYQPTDDGAAFGSASGALGVRGDVRIGGHNIDGGSNVLAYNFFPGTGNGGDMVIDTSELISGGAFVSTANNSRAFRNMLAHEHGHGIGLSHVDPVNTTKLMEPFLATNFDGPQFDDILAAQSLYGDPLEKNGRNDTAATATNLGSLVTGANQTLAQQISISNTTDTDYFKFTLGAGQNVTFTLQPEGPTYLQGPQGGATSSFNALAAGNLNMALYDTNGTTVLQVANINAAGLAETLANTSLAAGTYFVRVTMPTGTAQMYKLMATVTEGLAAPGTPDLAAASDTGLSNTDNITFDNTPTLSGTVAPNLQVLIFDGVDQIGTTTANGSGSWTFTTLELVDGEHSISVKASDGVNVSTASTTLALTIDTVAPTYLTTSYDREVTQRVTLVLSDAIAPQITVGDFSLLNTTTSANLVPTGVTYSAGNTTVTVALSSVFLLNGRYELSTSTSAASDVAGNPLQALNFQFTQLGGDANGDGSVTFDDLLIVTQNYNSSGKTYSQGNFNYDASGIVDFGDLLIVSQNYGATLFQSAQIIGASSVSKRRTNNVELLA